MSPSLSLLAVAAAGFVGGTMNALAGGGTFATLPALLGVGLPANLANATSNVALLPGAVASAWTYRDEIGPVGGIGIRLLSAITFASGLIGSVLLVVTPTHAFDLIVPWLVLYAFLALAFGARATAWLQARARIGRRTMLGVQAMLGIYGGYFGGGMGLMLTATYGLLTGMAPRALFAPRTLTLAVANAAAAIVFVAAGLVRWWACLPMMAGAIAGGWAGALVGRRLPAAAVRAWTLGVAGITCAVFFWRAYA